MTQNSSHSQIQKNRQVRRMMFEWGADLKKRHNIDHVFFMKNRKAAEDFTRWARTRGYTPGDIHEECDEHGERFSLVITAHACPDSDELDRQTIEMEQRAIEYECIYDGWGTMIEE